MKLSTVKQITRIVVGLGGSSITTQIIKNNVAAGSMTQKVTITAAMIVAGALVGEKLGDYTDEKIDEVVQTIAQIQADSETK